MRLFISIISLLLFYSCYTADQPPPYIPPVFEDDIEIPDPIYGCTDSEAFNYNSEAEIDDNSCEYKEEKPDWISVKDYHLFFDVIELGYNAVISNTFNDHILGNINLVDRDNPIVIAKIDELPLGAQIGKLSDKDLAIENGLYKGLLGKGYKVIEKLDHIQPRNPKEFIKTNPMDAFYMHGIDLEDLEIIKNRL